MAGLILAQIAVELGDRVRHLVFVGASIPADGQSMIDFTPAPMRWFLRPRFQKEVRRPGGAMTLPPKLAARIFCNDMNADDTAWVLGQLQPDSPSVALEPVTRSGFGPTYARTYVKLARDKAVPPRQADRCIANIAPTEVIDIDSGHNVMVSHPQLLADVLNRVIALAPS
jgi:pimeloyl-ACP methyl ester carboxylesterase